MKIIVIGKSGQLAKELAKLTSRECEVINLGRSDINLFDPRAMSAALEYLQPDAIINASAYTAVDLAESDSDNAFMLNEYAVKNITEACIKMGIHLVHVSTDFVFDGRKNTPYLPTDLTNPLSVYGASKRAGELVVFNGLPLTSCVIRTSWVYSIFGNNFVKTMQRLMAEREQLGIVGDQVGTPTNASGLANVCLNAATNKVSGMHHYTDDGVASWYDFAVAIQDIGVELGLLNKMIAIKAIPSSAYPTPATRPHYSVLDKTSLLMAMPSVKLTHWRHQLKSMMSELTN